MRALLAGLLCLPAAALAGALEDFQREVMRFDARFEQRLLDDDGSTLESYRGQMSLARPDRFLWQYESPYALQLGSDGQTLWHFDQDLRQITLRDAGPALAGTPAELLGGDPARLDDFEIRDEGRVDGLRWTELRPRSDDSDFELVRIGFEGTVPRAMQLRDRLGQITHMRFEQVQVNEQSPADRFELQIPEGVTVVDERAGS